MTRRRQKREVAPQLDATPTWDATTGNLCWRGSILIHLAPQAHAERAILDRFQAMDWRFIVKNPLARDALGDETGTRRSAIYNLMRHQGERPLIQFFSALDGYVAWCPVEWLTD